MLQSSAVARQQQSEADSSRWDVLATTTPEMQLQYESAPQSAGEFQPGPLGAH